MLCWAGAHSRGVEAAVDVDDRLALPGQTARPRRAPDARPGTAAGRCPLCSSRAGQVVRRGDDRVGHGPAHRGLAHLEQLDPVGIRGQLLRNTRWPGCRWPDGSRRRP